MERPQGFNVLSGANATVKWDGKPIYECRAFQPQVTLNRTDVQMSIDVDSKMTGASGSFTLQIYHVYTRIAQEILDALKQGKDVRFTIESRIDDPDAVGGQSETVLFNNCWINDFPLSNWERDSADSQEYNGGFTPTSAQIAEAIKQAA